MSDPSASPSTPQPRVRTCDASGMAAIHRYFRAGFGAGPDLVRGVREGDTGHAAVVVTQLRTLSTTLLAHHDGEEERLWPALEQRAPACALHVQRMRDQHAAMLAPLQDLDAALPRWRRTAASSDADPVLAALDGINRALAVHLPDEEQAIVPVMETTLTTSEVQWFSEHGRRATPKGETWNVLGQIMAAQPDGGTEFAGKNLPAPVRLLWRAVGRRSYLARQAQLRGQR